MECYVINLDRSPDRWEHMQKQLSTIGTQHTSLKIQRVVGVDGYKLTENEISFINNQHSVYQKLLAQEIFQKRKLDVIYHTKNVGKN